MLKLAREHNQDRYCDSCGCTVVRDGKCIDSYIEYDGVCICDDCIDFFKRNKHHNVDED